MKERLLHDVMVRGVQRVPPSNAFIEERPPFSGVRQRSHWIEIGESGSDLGACRHVYATKRLGVWNLPIVGAYVDVLILYVSKIGHLCSDSLQATDDPSRFESFRSRWEGQMNLDLWKRIQRAEGLGRRINSGVWKDYDYLSRRKAL